MSKKIYIKFVIITILSVMLGIVSPAAGGGGGGGVAPPAKFGFIYSIEGSVDFRAPRTDPIRLNKETDILRVISDGDKLRTNVDGKLVVVSLSTKMGYELMPDALVQITSNNLSAIRGTVNKIEGLYVPESFPSQPEKDGIMVIKNAPKKSCIRPLSPLNTSIITTTPKLFWENNCRRDHKVTVKLIANKRIIYQAITGDTFMKIPKDVLNFEDTCTWLIDGGENGIVGGTFSIVSENDMKEALEKKYHYTQHESDLHERVSYIYYLKSKGLNDLANSEIQLMKEDYPENPYIKVE